MNLRTLAGAPPPPPKVRQLLFFPHEELGGYGEPVVTLSTLGGRCQKKELRGGKNQGPHPHEMPQKP